MASVLYVVIDSKRFEGDGTFGTGYAKEHPDLVAGMLIASSIDLAAGIIAAARSRTAIRSCRSSAR